MSYFPQAETYAVGNYTIRKKTGFKILHTLQTNSANCNSSAREATGSAGYTPGASKQFRVQGVVIDATSHSATATLQFGYCDNDIGMGTNTAPTNPVYIYGSSSSYNFSVASTATGKTYIPIGDFIVPTGKYLFVVGSTVSIAQIDFVGHEEST